MMTNRDRMDLQFRIFLFDLLDNRELTFTDIKGSVARDYHEKKYMRQEIRTFLLKLLVNSLISRGDLEKNDRWDSCRYIYTLTDKGRMRRTYYLKQLQEGRTNGTQDF